jgi:TRAP-type C4-dicarboxylate transport system permease small subunit
MFQHLRTVIGLISSVLMFLLMMLTVVDVIGRNFLHAPLPGAAELTEMALPLLMFLLLPQITFTQKHITVELIDGISGPVMRFLQKLVASVAGAGLFFLIGWQVWVLGQRSASYGDVSTTLHIPIAPVLYVVAILSVICAFAFLGVLGTRSQPHASEESIIEEAKRSGV